MNSPIWTALDERVLGRRSLEVVVRRPHGTTPAMLDAQLQRRACRVRAPASGR